MVWNVKEANKSWKINCFETVTSRTWDMKTRRKSFRSLRARDTQSRQSAVGFHLSVGQASWYVVFHTSALVGLTSELIGRIQHVKSVLDLQLKRVLWLVIYQHIRAWVWCSETGKLFKSRTNTKRPTVISLHFSNNYEWYGLLDCQTCFARDNLSVVSDIYCVNDRLLCLHFAHACWKVRFTVLNKKIDYCPPRCRHVLPHRCKTRALKTVGCCAVGVFTHRFLVWSDTSWQHIWVLLVLVVWLQLGVYQPLNGSEVILLMY